MNFKFQLVSGEPFLALPKSGLACVALAAAFTSQTCACLGDSLALGYTMDKVEDVPRLEAWAFPLEEVRLLDGPFRHAQDLDGAYLLALDTERLVRNFRINAGLPTQAEPLGGWEAPACEL